MDWPYLSAFDERIAQKVGDATPAAHAEQTEQYGIWQATRLGADPVRVKVWQDWTEALWQ